VRGTGGTRLMGAVIAAVILFGAACNDDKNDGPASGTDDSGLSSEVASDTTTSTNPTTTTLSADEQVLQAYRAAWAAVEKALDPPNPQHPELLATHTGSALRLVQTQATDLQSQGAVARGAVEVHPKLLSRSDTEATIEDCIVDRGHVFDPATGQRLDLNAPDVYINHGKSHMIFEEGQWKRESSEQLSDTCTPS
jgi:hypothetical protein